MIALIPADASSSQVLSLALDRLGFKHRWAARPDDARDATLLILSGAASFEVLHAWLKTHGWWRELPHVVGDGCHLLALDTAMHLICEGSEEAPRESGLGLIPGLARRVGPGIRVPHLGWARTALHQPVPNLVDPRQAWLYYAHRYMVGFSEATYWSFSCGEPGSALVSRGRVTGIQPRLERSGTFGSVLLRALIEGMDVLPSKTDQEELN